MLLSEETAMADLRGYVVARNAAGGSEIIFKDLEVLEGHLLIVPDMGENRVFVAELVRGRK